MSNLLTDRKFWVDYWERKTGLAMPIPEKYLFHRQLKNLITGREIRSAIELGGFPGYYAVFLRKYAGVDVTLLDYFVHQPIVHDLLTVNNLADTDIKIIETDLFQYQPEAQYDLVLSCGLIEHFNDTADIIRRHIAFLKPGGTLFITLPNFHALNGWFQKTFDKPNFDKHNLNSMDPNLLASVCHEAGLKNVQSSYFGKFSIWFEGEHEKPLFARMLKKLTWVSGKVLTKIFPFESKKLSPYIILVAQKPSE
ncbi:bifunctional 2-polyprenyl-6-hydroxyphenol methylase/3-demethylubiquinol 3-O-methyltransferase UbiG [Pedobacter sp. SYP-B3415]|uniref:class I SAM-dependent methyltransferase n=1 Tax=Pedobacter sp. SYP-B3415 TaxID=2496641 RepID=UPI00101D718E|nr:methyltransferase domain-containing protein [Pedobacter sp. SYP-B3415]